MNKVQNEKGTMITANSWDKIAGWMGILAGNLQLAINEYNAACYQRV